jgi:hypothetical protein
MIKIAMAAVLAAIVVYDASVVPASTGLTETIERPRGLKGDRLDSLPVRPSGAGCSEAAWPHQQGDCVGGREQPAEQAPVARFVRLVVTGRTPAGNSSTSAI